MKSLLSALILCSLFFIEGCVQAPSNARKSSSTSSSSTSKTSSGTTSSPVFAADENSYWFTTTKTVGTVTINKNSQDIIYLRGKLVHDFLSSKDLSGTEYYRKQYCLVGNFSNTALYNQMRFRAVPIYVTSSNKATERLLRIDIPSESDNTSLCNNTTISSILPTTATYSLPGICSTCTGQVTTSELSLYEASTTLTKIESTRLNLSSTLIKVDLQSNSTDPSNSCSNSSCSAKGFDCCVSGQCVKDASEKTNASSDPQYQQAKSDYAINPLTFINYPNIFNICSNIAHTPAPPVNTTAPTPVATAQERVAKYLLDYTCTTDVTAGSGYNNCRSTTVAIDKTEAAYTAIKKKLAIACGCNAIDSEMSLKCPDWGIIPVYPSGAAKTNANITDFTCYTPAPVNPIGPITNLNVSVPNRSAPHRFYYLDANNKTTQEGDDFYYLDEVNKISPVNGSFNFNSILGKITLDLSHTNPAKEVNVELGKTYILSATSGYFTPCSQCAKDSWFQTFSAFPASKLGVGLQASGYSTSRDTYSGNTTFGNYEDTKFGRACYVPATMLPLAHQKNVSLQTQRLNRLKTQAAFYINGYQRDWYGFNQGALIGSFDGVTWFAIGSGRRATATSTKLYLAINAAFLDLADKTDTIVNIIPDFAANTAADYDYDPTIALTDPRQNTAATCQKFHQCSVDADCVAQLGWEYTCTDVSQFKTKWPLYDSDGNETANQERTGSFFEILQSTINTSNGKRCVYRGAGAPCKRDYSTLNDYNKKNLTCAPNFYCASLTSNKFNDELVRSPNEPNDMLFGMDANVLGRPLNYVTASKGLLNEIIANIKYNSQNAIGLSSGDSDDMGICRPGRALSSVDLTAHMNADVSKRTDYISQIGSCNSAATNTTRFLTCPAFNDELNYVDPSALDISTQKQTQNSCGGESKHTSTFISAFKNIEGLALLNLQNISQPILAQDACFRRAGSVCHSDLDCGPNKMHEDAVGTIDIKYFGGTEGEQQYWKESLICGQSTPTPTLGIAGYLDYNLNENRCCREIGKDFTMVTSGPKSIIPENVGTNENLITSKFTYKDPTAANRYSRYTISKEAINDSTTIPAVTATAEPKSNQWRVINETGSLTCCGGGWIRKFADGTHDWKIKNRLSIDANNFNCLNFRSPLANSSYSNFTADKVVAASYQREYEFFCKSPDGAGCFQIPYPNSENFNILAPLPYEPSQKTKVDNNWVATSPLPGYATIPAAGRTRLDTSPTADPIDGSTPWAQVLNSDVPYSPIPYYFSPIPYDTDFDTGKAYNFFTDKTFDYGVQFYLPAYIGWTAATNNIKKVYIKYFFDAPQLPQVYDITLRVAPAGECTSVIMAPPPAAPISAITVDNQWCITRDVNKTQNRPVVLVKADTTLNWKYAGVIIDFEPIEKATKTAEPGNPLYYLSKLGRLELTGIPQITYEPLYCNDNQNNLVPGIFKSSISTRALFTAAGTSITYTGIEDPIERYNADSSISTHDSTSGYGNFEQKFTFQDKLDHSAVFSSKDFTCCTPLGKSTTAATKCCSGYAVASSDGKSSICKLPRGADLNVYFNKFVSSEGVGEDQPSGGLIVKGTDAEVDFNAYTGEPKFRGATYDKLVALGNSYCSSGLVITGGAFGAFPPEPFSGSYTLQAESTGNLEDYFPVSIVDSVLDFQTSDPTVGKVPFDAGNKWNHHYYCK